MAGCAAGGWLIAVLAAAPVPAPPPAPAPPPSLELLLHLAEFGDAEDRYIDPAELEAAVNEEPQGQTREARGTQDDAPQDEDL